MKNSQKILTRANLGHFKKFTQLILKIRVKTTKSELVKNVSKSERKFEKSENKRWKGKNRSQN